jgi:hypothetical protein
MRSNSTSRAASWARTSPASQRGQTAALTPRIPPYLVLQLGHSNMALAYPFDL